MDQQQYYNNNQNQPQVIMPGQQVVGQPMMQAAQPGVVQQPAMVQPGQPVAGQTVIMPGQQMMPEQQILQGNGATNVGAANAVTNQAAVKPLNKDVPSSTQSTILISELRDNVVIMKDGSFRAVVACKSINFDLMSEMEREGVEYAYQNFLNSLKFTTQILVRSQRVDIGPYIERLSEIRRNNDNMLLGVLMDDYINFIDILSQEANIMDKAFFIVVPYYTSEDTEKALQQTKNFFKSFSKNKVPEITRIDRATYDKALSELTNRVDSIISGLFQIGISSIRLNTKELAELYYNFNNPCSTIIADYTDKNIKVKNHTDDIVLTAFGVKANPDWQDYSEFLEDRCIPRTRAGLQNYLDALKIDEYNPLDIIKKTEGRMAEDYQWIKVTEL